MRTREVLPNGVIETVEDGDEPGTLRIHRTSDAQALLDRNAELRNSGFNGMGKDRTGMRYVGSIDANLIKQWGMVDGVDVMRLPAKEFEAYIMRKLMDPDWKYLRVVDRI